MKKELELELVKKYPRILRDYGGDPMQTCLSWGFEFGDGWKTLIENCLKKLQYFCDLCSKNGKEVQVIANQAKEKYGTLCFYVSIYGADSIENGIINDIINQAELESHQTCEETGTYGTLCVKNGWYKTLSYEEARKLGYKACNENTESYWKEKDREKHSN